MRVTNTLKYTLAERDIYGSKRIGADFTPVQLIGALPVSMIDTFGRYLGMKQYEMDNHLGNVLATVSDRKIPISLDTTTGTAIDHYEADVLSSQDYYGFGMEEPGRNFNSTGYRFGFNAKLKDDEIYGAGNSYDYGMRFYDPRLGRFMSIDPLVKKYPDFSPYLYAADNPIQYIDKEGKGVELPPLGAENYLESAGYCTSVNLGNGFKESSISGIGSYSEVSGFALDHVGTLFSSSHSQGVVPNGVNGPLIGSLMVANHGAVAVGFADQAVTFNKSDAGSCDVGTCVVKVTVTNVFTSVKLNANGVESITKTTETTTFNGLLEQKNGKYDHYYEGINDISGDIKISSNIQKLTMKDLTKQQKGYVKSTLDQNKNAEVGNKQKEIFNNISENSGEK